MIDRVFGDRGDAGRGPTVVGLAALHGNEPAGIVAVERVLSALADRGVRGRFVGVIGNRSAYEAQRRFMGRDLNRGWSDERCARTANPAHDSVPEDAEQRELLTLLRRLASESRRPLVVLDLHSMSGPGVPFSIAPDMLRNRPLLATLPVPTVLGLAEIIPDALLSWLCRSGHRGIAIEGGQHDDAETIDLLEACVWFALVKAGLLSADDVPDLRRHRARLRAAAVGNPPVVEIKHRHGVTIGDGFEMRPGYSNFTRVRAGEVVASDRRGPIEIPRDGLMMLPRYQQEGDDGFFVAIPMTPGWLRTSTFLRRTQLGRLLPLLPRMGRDERGDLLWGGAAPKGMLLGALHLLGYRSVTPTDDGFVVRRTS